MRHKKYGCAASRSSLVPVVIVNWTVRLCLPRSRSVTRGRHAPPGPVPAACESRCRLTSSNRAQLGSRCCLSMLSDKDCAGAAKFIGDLGIREPIIKNVGQNLRPYFSQLPHSQTTKLFKSHSQTSQIILKPTGAAAPPRSKIVCRTVVLEESGSRSRNAIAPRTLQIFGGRRQGTLSWP